MAQRISFDLSPASAVHNRYGNFVHAGRVIAREHTGDFVMIETVWETGTVAGAMCLTRTDAQQLMQALGAVLACEACGCKPAQTGADASVPEAPQTAVNPIEGQEIEFCECGRKPEECATFEDAEADHGDRQ